MSISPPLNRHCEAARRKVWRLLGNKVLLRPILAPGATLSGLVIPNKYDRPAVHFQVLGIGPGALLPRPKLVRNPDGEIVWKPGKKVWVQPDVMPGDIVLSRHWLEGGEGGLPQPVHIDREDGRGMVIVDCRYLIAKVEMPLSEANDF